MPTVRVAGFTPNPRQLEAAEASCDPDARILVLHGAIRSGKTQAGARLLLEWAVAYPAQYLVGRATYRTLHDSTMKALLYGDGGQPPLIPPELVAEYRAGEEKAVLVNGSEILFRSVDDKQWSKILGLSLAGALIDQIEEIEPGPDGELVFDTLLGRLSDPRGPRRLIAVMNPAPLTSWQDRRLADAQTRDRKLRFVHFDLRDNAVNLPDDYVEAMEATRETRPSWYRTYVRGERGAFSGAAYPEFETAVHVVRPFPIPAWWERFESMDHGAANPTAWLAWAADGDGNLVVFAEHYEAGKLVSHHAETVLERRRDWYPLGARPVCYADPSISARMGTSNKWGQPASVLTEYAEHGIQLTLANNDPRAGYARLLELLHIEPERLPPPWAQVPAEAGGAPRMYVFSSCGHVVDQIRSAPLATEGSAAGEMVDRKTEGQHLHAHAALRYGAMSRPSPSSEPLTGKVDQRAELLRRVHARFDRDATRGAGRRNPSDYLV